MSVARRGSHPHADRGHLRPDYTPNSAWQRTCSLIAWLTDASDSRWAEGQLWRAALAGTCLAHVGTCFSLHLKKLCRNKGLLIPVLSSMCSSCLQKLCVHDVSFVYSAYLGNLASDTLNDWCIQWVPRKTDTPWGVQVMNAWMCKMDSILEEPSADTQEKKKKYLTDNSAFRWPLSQLLIFSICLPAFTGMSFWEWDVICIFFFKRGWIPGIEIQGWAKAILFLPWWSQQFGRQTDTNKNIYK